MSKSKILFQISGSIATYKACQAISQLVKQGHEVQVVATPTALQFVGEPTLEGLTGRGVLSQSISPGQMMEHIHLTDEYDVAVLCPATALKINQLAAGVAGDLIGDLFLAWDYSNKPYHLFPAMNHRMLNHPTTQNSLNALKNVGVLVHETGDGSLACGHQGQGRLLEPEQILEKILTPHKTRFRVLITGGGTREPIDGVRSLTNSSTGSTSAELANVLRRLGHHVTEIRSRHSTVESSTTPLLFETTDDLERLLKSELSTNDYDLVIQAAAVSDFIIDSIYQDSRNESLQAGKGKLSSQEGLTLQLKPNKKLLPMIKSWSENPRMKVVGFKLTEGSTLEESKNAVEKVLESPDVDMVVHNDLRFIRKGSPHQHHWTLYSRTGPLNSGMTVKELGVCLGSLLTLPMPSKLQREVEL